MAQSHSAVTRQAAASDPTGFVDFGELMVIDETQRVPGCCSRSKSRSTPTHGQGGSCCQLHASPWASGAALHPTKAVPKRSSSDRLSGRDQQPPGQLRRCHVRYPGALNHTSSVSRGDYTERIVRGGFPEAVARANPARRERFFDKKKKKKKKKISLRLFATCSGQLLGR